MEKVAGASIPHVPAGPSETQKKLVFDKVTEYRMEERLTAPDSFFVRSLPAKIDVFKIAGKLLSFHGVKRMYDMNDNELFFMNQKFNSTLQLQYLMDKRTGELYTLRKKGFLPGRGRGTILVWNQKGDEGDVFMEVKSSAGRSEFDMLKDGKRVATVVRGKFGAKRLFSGLDSYNVRVEPGFDVVLALIITACIDEHYTEGQA